MKKLLAAFLCTGLLFGCSSKQVEEKQEEKPEVQTQEEKKEEGITCKDLVCELENIQFTLGDSPVELIQHLQQNGWYVDYSSYIISGNDYDLEFSNEDYDQFIKICFDLDQDQNEIKQAIESEHWDVLKGCKMYEIEVDFKDYQHTSRLVDFKVSKTGINSLTDDIVKDLSSYQIETNVREVEESPWNPAMSIVEGSYYYGNSASEGLKFTYWADANTKLCQGIRYAHYIY